jgi:hypothetical protein
MFRNIRSLREDPKPLIEERIVTKIFSPKEIRRFGRSPSKKICRWSSGDPELMEDAFQAKAKGIVVGVDRFGFCRLRVGRRGWAEARRGLAGVVAQDDQSGDRLETAGKRLVATRVADAADDVFAAKFFVTIAAWRRP